MGRIFLEVQMKGLRKIKKFQIPKKGIQFSTKTILVYAITIAVLAFVVGFIIRVSLKTDYNGESSRQSYVEQSHGQSQNTETIKQKPDKTDWKLMLVNRENPIKQPLEVNPVKVGNNQYVDEKIQSQLKKMLDDARKAGVSPLICSSYRTEEKQKNLYENKISKNKKTA